jgi:uncharacterized protein (UPF0332 family)
LESDIKKLADYRLEKAERNLNLAKDLFINEAYSFALNRVYYAAFDAIRAVNALDGFDSSKHSGVIAHFNQNHVKTGHFEPGASTIIKRASMLREKSDYEDFFEADRNDVEETIEEVQVFIDSVRDYLELKMK